jgi:quercetin dioxygenase-like cupin family protein
MKDRCLALLWTFVMVLLVGACGTASQSGPPPSPTKAQGNTVSTLAQGKLTSLPAGTLYINVINIPQPAGNTITHKHVAGFVYVVDGTHILAIQGGQTLTLKAGEAGFVGTGVMHTHTNPGTTPSDWYFISIRPTTARTAPPLFPNQKVLYATPDLPTLPSGAYDESLRLVSLPSGGTGPAHKGSGIEVVFVLTGSISVQMAGQAPATVTQGQGSYSLPNTAIQVVNRGSSDARYLAFDVDPAG